MKKKTYTKPIVSVFVAEGTAILAGSGDDTTKEKYNFSVDGVRENTSDIIWGNPDEIDANENPIGWE